MGTKNPFYVDIQSRQDSVTGSGNVVTVSYPDGSKDLILVDFGMFQGPVEQVEKNPELKFNPAKLTAIILTHAHCDHCGRIPMLYRLGANCKTFMTADTLSIAEVMLYDTATILENSFCDKLYDANDVETSLKYFRACKYNDEINVNSNISFRFIHNAHIAGAAMVYMKVSYSGFEDICILFSGDYKEEDVFLEPTIIPEEILNKPLVMMLESTYGAVTKKSEEQGVFRKEIAQEISKGKTIVIPAFAFGRTQRVLYELRQMQEERMLSLNLPIYLDGGMAIRITNKWERLESVKLTDFKPRGLHLVSDTDMRRHLMEDGKQKIIVTTSGMVSFGPARSYIPNYIGSKNACIYLTGFSTPESAARKILEAGDGAVIEVCGIMCKKSAEVHATYEFSSHARQDELVDFTQKFKKINFLLINHGEEESKNELGKQCMQCSNIKKVGIMDGATDFRVGPYGLIKTLKM